jgi:tetratricopeptide (TPR) repeat protein
MQLKNFPVASAALCVVLVSFAMPPRAGAQEPTQSVSLQVVKDLYASAAYEDALTAVGKLDAEAPNFEADEYRVFCLVALGRVDDAEKAIETVLMARPEYHTSSAEASPRIQALFAKVRRRIGPALVKKMYQQAKAAMDRKDREEAIAQFEAMLRIADDRDVRDEENMAELRELGNGFLELSRAMPSKKAAPAPAQPAAAAPAPSVIVPPVAIRQQLPGWVPDPMSRSATEFHGAVRVQIGVDGKVLDADMVKALHPAYGQLVRRAAINWLYQPATKDGTPIPSEKTVQIAVTPPPSGASRAADKSLPF